MQLSRWQRKLCKKREQKTVNGWVLPYFAIVNIVGVVVVVVATTLLFASRFSILSYTNALDLVALQLIFWACVCVFAVKVDFHRFAFYHNNTKVATSTLRGRFKCGRYFTQALKAWRVCGDSALWWRLAGGCFKCRALTANFSIANCFILNSISICCRPFYFIGVRAGNLSFWPTICHAFCGLLLGDG